MSTEETNGKTAQRAVPTTTEFKHYPDFHGDHAAEIIWLQQQFVLSQERLALASERLRIRADFWEAKQELSLLHASHSERLQERVNELESGLAKTLAHLPADPANEAMLTLGLRDHQAEQCSALEHNAFPKGRWTTK